MGSYYIIEKEAEAVNGIRSFLAEFHEFHFVGSSDKTDVAMNAILKEMPNLIFVNIDNTIEMPFQFINELKHYLDSDPIIVAISATKDKAYDAIKNGFFDYLLKPFAELELRKILVRVKQNVGLQTPRTVCIKSYKDYKYLNTNEILFLKADNNTTDFYMKDGHKISAFKTLKTFEKVLPKNFFRIHKSYVINSNHVSGINYGKQRCTISKGKLNIPFTKTYMNNVKYINNTLSQSSFISLN